VEVLSVSDEIVWEDPPPAKQGGWLPWRDRLQPLRDRPNEWARVSNFPTVAAARSIAGPLSAGKIAVPEGKWEFTARELEDGRGAIYARYLGP
jgi:hypothetical protein